MSGQASYARCPIPAGIRLTVTNIHGLAFGQESATLPMTTFIIIFAVSIVLQFTAVFLAFRLIRTTGWQIAWSVITVALLLMGLRLSISFVNMLESSMTAASHMSEIVALGISALMAVGVALIGPMFSSRQKAEQALCDSESNLRALTENINDGILVTYGGNYVFANQRVAKMLGYTLQEMYEVGLIDVVHPDEYPRVLERLQRRLAGEWAPEHYETTYVKKNGEPIPVELTAARTMWNGRAAGLVAVRDISQRRKAERVLREVLQERDQFFDLSVDMLCIAGYDGYFKDLSPAWENVLGYTREELTQHKFIDLVHPEDQAGAIAEVDRLSRSNNATIDFVVRVRGKDGIFRYLQWSAISVHDKQTFYAVAHDITEIRLVQEELRKARDELELRVLERTSELARAKDDAQLANQAKSDFLSRMSHELRTPLNSILGFGQLLEGDPANSLSADQQDYTNEILTAGRHLLGLINEVLDLAKIEAGRIDLVMETVAVHDIIGACHGLVAPMADTGNVKLTFDSSNCQHLSVKADRLRLQEVLLLNLLSNAVKYNNEGGTVCIDCERTSTHALRIRVTDTGVGVSPQHQAVIFEPFNRLDTENQQVEGTGIGLAITQRLVHLMDGELGVDSQPGKGSCFWVELPLANLANRVTPVYDEPGSDEYVSESLQTTGRVRKVLYVEDNPANLKLVEQLIHRHEHIHLLTAETAEQGLSMATQQLPDLILLDINLPGMSGYDVLKHLRNQDITRNIPTVAVSANAMPRDIQQGRDAGFADYVTKPINIQRFNDMLETILQ